MKILKRYARKRARTSMGEKKGRGRPRGIVMLSFVDGKAVFGWSLCHKNDKFEKKLGTKIALGRLQNSATGQVTVIPKSLAHDLQKLLKEVADHGLA